MKIPNYQDELKKIEDARQPDARLFDPKLIQRVRQKVDPAISKEKTIMAIDDEQLAKIMSLMTVLGNEYSVLAVGVDPALAVSLKNMSLSEGLNEDTRTISTREGQPGLTTTLSQHALGILLKYTNQFLKQHGHILLSENTVITEHDLFIQMSEELPHLTAALTLNEDTDVMHIEALPNPSHKTTAVEIGREFFRANLIQILLNHLPEEHIGSFMQILPVVIAKSRGIPALFDYSLGHLEEVFGYARTQAHHEIFTIAPQAPAKVVWSTTRVGVGIGNRPLMDHAEANFGIKPPHLTSHDHQAIKHLLAEYEGEA